MNFDPQLLSICESIADWSWVKSEMEIEWNKLSWVDVHISKWVYTYTSTLEVTKVKMSQELVTKQHLGDSSELSLASIRAYTGFFRHIYCSHLVICSEPIDLWRRSKEIIKFWLFWTVDLLTCFLKVRININK